MNWIEFIYQLIGKHVLITKMELAQLKLEAQQWFDKEETKEGKIGKFLHTYGEVWWVKTALAILFIFASRWLLEFMNPVFDDIEDAEDDDRGRD